MPKFEIETPQGRFEVEAPDQETAIRALQKAAKPHVADHNAPAFNPGVEGYNPETGMVDKPTSRWDQAGAFLAGAQDIPIAGPLVKNAVSGVAAGLVSPFSDESFGDIQGQMRGGQERVMRENPGSALAGQVVGTTAALAPLGATGVGAKALGLSGSLPARMGMSAASGSGISGADTAVRGGDAGDIALSAALGGGIGGAIPAVGYRMKAGYRAVRDKVGGAVRGAFNPEAEAGKCVASAMGIDQKTPAGVLGPDDLAAAARNNQPIMNADMGGETTRALARAAANQSPEARGAMERVVSDRFSDQGNRVAKLINRLSGGKTDDLLMVEGIKDAAAAANKPAYSKAFNSPAAQKMYSPDLQELMQAPAVRKAVGDVTERSANRGAAEGFKAVNNPFHKAADGSFKLRQKADGTFVTPTLQFWDQVKRNLDSEIGKAKRAGDNEYTRELMGLKTKLVKSLDGAIPEYKTARQGAAAFFGAEDAVEAGRNFAKSSKSLPEFKRGILAMKPAEKEAFETGFASELIDMAKNAGDRTNVVTRMFKSPEAREKMVMAFGKERAREIEAFVRVETAMDALRGAFGNSTTARQLIESGVIGGGAWWYTGDFNTGIAAAALTQGARMAGKKIDGNVMTKTAEMLLSNDPKIIEKAVRNAAMSPQHMAAIDALTKLTATAARGANVAISGQVSFMGGQALSPTMPGVGNVNVVSPFIPGATP